MLHGIEIFGQHEIGALTKDPSKITLLLERFIEESDTTEDKKSNIKNALEQNRTAILQKIKSKKLLQEKVEQLPAAEEELERFKQAGVEEKLKEKSFLIKEESSFKAIKKAYEDLEVELDEDGLDFDLSIASLDDKQIGKLPGKSFLSEVREEMASLEKELNKSLENIRKKVEQSKLAVEAIQKEWTTKRKLPADKEYLKLLKELQTESIDADSFVKLQEKIESLTPEDTKLKAIEKEIELLLQKRKKMVEDLQECLQKEFSDRSKAAKKVSKKLQNILKVDLNYCGDRSPFIQTVRDTIGGRLSEFERSILSKDDFSLPSFIDACRSGPEAIEKTYKISKDQSHRITEKAEELCLKLEELELPHTTIIELNISKMDDPQWKPMNKLSKGQKATALLLLLLQESSAPLIIDQPEDDLDNQFIADGIVPRMRAEKLRRQFVFSSHNANLPVLGDAELILALSADGEAGTGRVSLNEDAVGSIDTPNVQRIVETILEGGHTAFETRRKKYGF